MAITSDRMGADSSRFLDQVGVLGNERAYETARVASDAKFIWVQNALTDFPDPLAVNE